MIIDRLSSTRVNCWARATANIGSCKNISWPGAAIVVVALTMAPAARGSDTPVVPTEVTIKLGEVKLFPVKDQGNVLLTNSDSCLCGAYVLGEDGTAKGVLIVPFVASDRPIEITVASSAALSVYKITVVAEGASNKPANEVAAQEVPMRPGQSVVYELPLGPLGTLVTYSNAICSTALGASDTTRGFRVVGERKGYGYVALATSKAGDLRLFKFIVK